MAKRRRAAPFEKGRDLRLVIVCEDTATTDKAVDILHWLSRQLMDEAGRLFFEWWNFEFLADADLWAKFMAQTAAADLIIIGLHERLEFPGRFATWLRQLPNLRKRRSGAMIGLLEPALGVSDAEPAMFSQLKQAAARSCMDFFATQAAPGMELEAFRGVVHPRPPIRRQPAIQAPRLGRFRLQG